MTLDSVARQRISDALDGEIEPGQLEMALADARTEDGRKAWDLYHEIGDLLRSDELNVPLSCDFAARMAARLAAEPVVLAPVHQVQRRKLSIRRLVLPGALAAAAAAVAFIATPQLMVAMHATPDHVQGLASASGNGVARAAMVAGAPADTAMRGQDIDEYLIAHQRFSPSVYSSTQYARPVAVANGTTGK
jgi:sigma-E factor negative regulatory protein RseA